MYNPNEAPRAEQQDPAWVKWWRSHPGGAPVQHVETKGKRKRTRRERRRK
jgi:hypothetical protein